MIPDEAVEAAAARLLHRMTGKSPLEATASEAAMFMDDARAALEAAAPHMLSHEREQTRLAHVDAAVNAQTVDRLEQELSEAVALMSEMINEEPCWFDHHGGCQSHGYLSLQPGETCPQQDAKDLVRQHEA